ncbi:hypothetical protein ACC846_37830, partial [Rhizobium ruizarguesonis]
FVDTAIASKAAAAASAISFLLSRRLVVVVGCVANDRRASKRRLGSFEAIRHERDIVIRSLEFDGEFFNGFSFCGSSHW